MKSRTVALLASTAVLSSLGAVWATVDAGKSPPEKVLSQDPRTWVVDGKIRPDLIPSRVGIDLAPIGAVYIDPYDFYPSLGADRSQPVPVFDAREGGTPVGEYDFASSSLSTDGVGGSKVGVPDSTVASEG
jgi:hypothetical protein